ncbi:MAG TPA: mechanosensitive ion channel domain-containing protein [Actinomycetota bacterium]|jgi:small conductance mechanosensitive channel|nr:mechanosensitive ion channel domain-containing protein [Actinomycetota bacterium]
MVVASHVPIDTRAWLLSHGIKIMVILSVAAFLLFLGRLAVRRMQRKLEGVDSVTQEFNLRRSYTLTHALSYVLRVVVWTVTVLLLLGELGLMLGPLIAGAGIAGIALAFGAQSLVRDFLSGFFILLENQFGVGDVIDISAPGGLVSGKVEDLSLRTTSVRAFDGTLFVVPNGNIQFLGNKSKGWSRAIVDIGVAYGEDLDGVREILDELFEELRKEEKMEALLFAGPTVLGPEQVGNSQVTMRVVAETRPGKKPDLERELRKRILRRFGERGVRVPG